MLITNPVCLKVFDRLSNLEHVPTTLECAFVLLKRCYVISRVYLNSCVLMCMYTYVIVCVPLSTQVGSGGGALDQWTMDTSGQCAWHGAEK